MKKQLKHALAMMLCATMTLACGDECEPQITTMTVREYQSNDGGSVTKVDRYIYADDRLTKHVTTQNYLEESTSREVSFTYTGNEVILESSEGNTAVYTLGSDNYAKQCTYRLSSQTRTYQFTYSDGYLTRVEETIDGIPSMNNEFEYKDGDLIAIITGTNKLLCTPDTTGNYSKLPCLPLTETYPLSLHTDAMYAHLLGKPTRHLIGKLTPDAEDAQEKTEYTYKTDDKGRVTNIEDKLTYTGTTINIRGQIVESTEIVEKAFFITYD